MALQIDPAALAQELLPLVKETLGQFLQAEAKDLHDYAWRIAQNYSLAIARGDTQWGEELKAQTRGLLELARIRAEVAAIDLSVRALGIFFKVAVAAIGVALK